jgi:hypothetical protein
MRGGAGHGVRKIDEKRAGLVSLDEADRFLRATLDEVIAIHRSFDHLNAREQAVQAGIRLIVIKLREAKRGFVLLPRRWRRTLLRLARPLPSPGPRLRTTRPTFAGFHWLAFLSLMLNSLFR